MAGHGQAPRSDQVQQAFDQTEMLIQYRKSGLNLSQLNA